MQIVNVIYFAAFFCPSRGSTVDLTIINLTDNYELDMGTPFDLFDIKSWPDSASATSSQRAGRMLLQVLMIKHGFEPYPKEWWHFTLKEEPYPETYFDFSVE